MIKGYEFILHLQTVLLPEQSIGKYHFVKWMNNGGLQFRINKTQLKTIPAELLALSFFITLRNRKIKNKVIINKKWIIANGYSDWCFVEVINVLINNFSYKFQFKSL